MNQQHRRLIPILADRPPMLMPTLPPSLAGLLASFATCFTTPTFKTFTALVCGLVAQTGPRTVAGMPVGAGLNQAWPHDRAHSFSPRARRSPDRLGLLLSDLIIGVLVDAHAPVRVVVDDTLLRRAGRKVFGAAWPLTVTV